MCGGVCQHWKNLIELQIVVVRNLLRRLAQFRRFRYRIRLHSGSLNHRQPARLAGNHLDQRALRPVNFHGSILTTSGAGRGRQMTSC
jgi:hypothetical protein